MVFGGRIRTLSTNSLCLASSARAGSKPSGVFYANPLSQRRNSPAGPETSTQRIDNKWDDTWKSNCNEGVHEEHICIDWGRSADRRSFTGAGRRQGQRQEGGPGRQGS